eukprot:3934946-Rhodomonas_salina.2
MERRRKITAVGGSVRRDSEQAASHRPGLCHGPPYYLPTYVLRDIRPLLSAYAPAMRSLVGCAVLMVGGCQVSGKGFGRRTEAVQVFIGGQVGSACRPMRWLSES